MKDKAMAFEDLWNQVVKVIREGRVSSRIIRTIYGDWIEIRLSSLGLAIWPHVSSNDLKFLNRLLAKILRDHGAIIKKSNGVRWTFIPLNSIPIDEKSTRRKLKKAAERRRVMVEEVWVWSW